MPAICLRTMEGPEAPAASNLSPVTRDHPSRPAAGFSGRLAQALRARQARSADVGRAHVVGQRGKRADAERFSNC